MAKKKKADPHAEKVNPGVQPKRGPRGSQSAAMNWLSSRMEGHPSGSQARLRAKLGDEAYEKLSRDRSGETPVQRARRRRSENASTDYSKLHLLGRALVEMSIKKQKKAERQKGQGVFPGMSEKHAAWLNRERDERINKRDRQKKDPGTHQKGSRRQARAVPRRRGTDPKGTRAIDKPSKRERRGRRFKPKEQGTRASDVAARGAAKGATKALDHHIPSKTTARSADLFTAYSIGNIAKDSIRRAVTPFRFGNRTKRAKKQNPHTATSPID